jgi:hypothetical protein
MALANRSQWLRPPSVLTWPRMPPWLARNLPAVVLVLASITYAEFLTGSTVVLAALLDPSSLAFLLGIYGAGVLLVREASVRWSKGWPTVLLLGAAYGIAEEGLGTKTFFGPRGVGALAVYGHWIGVNWVWSVELALFHAIFSIALPIATVGLLFPATQGRSFLPSRRALVTTGAIFLATVAAMFVLFNRPETPSLALVLAAVAAIGLLVVLARRAPSTLAASGARDRSGLGLSPMAAGAAFTWGFFGIVWAGPSLIPVPAVVIAATLAWTVGFGWLVASRRTLLRAPYARAGFVFGALTFLLVLAAFEGVFGDFGAFVVVAVLIFGFLRLRKRLGAPIPAIPVGASLGSAAPRETSSLAR